MKRLLAALLAFSICLIPMNSTAKSKDASLLYAANVPPTTAVSALGYPVSRGGARLNPEDYIATGDVILKDGHEFTAIVKGDVNGDGSITSTDFMQVRRNYLGLFGLNDLAFKAADVNGDNKINSTDFMQIRRHFLKLYDICPDGVSGIIYDEVPSLPQEEEKTLFASSFEDEDAPAMQSTLDNNRVSAVKNTENSKSGMTVKTGTGPSVTWNDHYQNVGFTGDKALTVHGIHQGSGKAYCNNVIYSDLSIPVTENTRLSYVLYPSTLARNNYDYNYTQMYLCLDLAFSDGTYLSTLGALDQNGFGLTAQEQGDSQALYTNQWNYIESKIGDVAKGKIIEKIIVTYSNNQNKKGSNAEFLAFFDDIEIKNSPDIVYEHLSDYVNILRGTNSSSYFSRGLTTPAVTYPHGFNIFTPVTDKGDKLPYSYQHGGERNTLSSLQISHCSSYWIGFYGTWQFMANTSVNPANGITADSISAENRAARFSHQNEIAKAHYYSVTFDEDSNASGVKIELTPTMYGAMVRFTFPEGSGNRNIIFDCENANGGLSFNSSTGAITANADDSLHYSRRLHIYGEFLDIGTDKMKYTKANAKSGIISFDEGVTTVTLKLATSFISSAQAKKNLSLDMGEFYCFEDAFDAAQSKWDELLGMIEIEGASFTELVNFYSSMYRIFGHPNLLTENTGTAENPIMQYASPYSGRFANPAIKDGALVCNTGLWDTYRTAWPAYTFFNYGGVDAKAMMDGLLQHFVEKGWNGQWISYSGIQAMIGTHSDIIYADAALKGVDFDYETAFKSMLKNASVVKDTGSVGREEQQTAVFTGYVTNSTPRGLAWTLDNCVNDYGIYRMAEILGLTDEAEYYQNRALAYLTVFNDDIDFFMGKDASGNWSKNKNNFYPEEWLSDFCESNAWNQAFNLVYDVQGMINLYGGRDSFNSKLDKFFSTTVTNVGENSIHEVREMREVRLGQYEHSNQVAHHIPYMYDYSGQPWKTQETVRSLLSRCYVGSEIGQGYIGDEDNGEQSGWYVFSALGFYPVNLASNEYAIGSPLFKKTTIHLPTGDITITAQNNSAKNIYIQSCKVNGQSYDKAYFTQELFSSGDVNIEFVMGDKPSSWATSEASTPSSLSQSGSTVNYKSDKLTSSNCTVSGGDNPSSLFDNTSDTACTSASQLSVTVNLGKKITASMLTITSANNNKNAAPVSFTLYGSSDGTNWTKLDSRTNISFEWEQYTRPFAIPKANRNAYQYYKIDMSGKNTLSVAELELIG